MASKKKSIISGIKTVLSIIFVLSVLNYFLTSYFNNKLLDKGNKIILIDKCLLFLNQVNDENQNFDISAVKIKLSQLKKVDVYLSLLSNGGKTDDILLTNKISSSDDNINNILSEIEKKLRQVSESLRNYSEIENPVFEKERKLINMNLAFSIKKIIKIKKTYQQSISSNIYSRNFTDIFTLLLILLSAFLIYFRIKNKLSENIKELHLQVQNFTENKDSSTFENNEEFELISNEIASVNLKFKEIFNFIRSLLSDNYEIDFPESQQKDLVQNSLINLRNKLKKNIELNNKRQEEEQRRQWFAEGQAKFNDILREASFGVKNLAETSLINMVKFLNAAQGGFFILNDNEAIPYLELSSAFAYDRIKLLSKRIELGDGLVGMCAVEKNTVVITDVPEDYMQIESGLGEAAPTNILIIPLKTEDNILGVIEIASFYEFQKNEIEFIENIAENIASTLETTKISRKTAELLQETQKKSDELAVRDTEMSEKISELKDAQKETKRSVSEMNAMNTVIDKVLFKIELTTAGKISSVNNMFLNRLGYLKTEMRNKSFVEFIKDKNKKILEEIYNKIAQNNFTQQEIIFITKENSQIKISSFFSAVRNEKGEIVRVLMLADNTSYREELKKKNNLLKEELNTKIRIISEKEKEISSIFNKVKQKGEITDTEVLKLKKREAELLTDFETPSEKKYIEWLKDVKSEK